MTWRILILKLQSFTSITLVENIPEDLPLSINGMTHVPLTSGLHSLLDRTKRSVEVVSPVWDLNSWDQETWPNTASEVQNKTLVYILKK